MENGEVEAENLTSMQTQPLQIPQSLHCCCFSSQTEELKLNSLSNDLSAIHMKNGIHANRQYHCIL